MPKMGYRRYIMAQDVRQDGAEAPSTAPEQKSLPAKVGSAVWGGIRAVGKGIRTGAEKFVSFIRDSYDNFHLTIAEGNYHIKPKSLWTLVTGKGQEADTSAATTFVGTAMLDTGRSFGKRMMWASAIALISMQAMVWVAGGLAIAGAALFYLEYAQSRKAKQELITEVNFAGQTVQGTRADLYHLHKTQEQIMNVGSAFKQASMESTTDTIDRLIGEVSERAKRVKVLDGGRYQAGAGRYEFSEPAIKLVKDQPREIIAPRGEVSKLGSPAPAFNAAAHHSADEVAKRIIELEASLPPDILEKVMQARMARPAAPQVVN